MPPRLRRSALYVPASNERAMAKARRLGCDVLVIDLEDAVAEHAKVAARQRMQAFLLHRPRGPEVAVRVNPRSGKWGADDLSAAAAAGADAVLLPKVETPRDILEADEALDEADAPAALRLWAMIETPRAMLNVGAIAELGRNEAARLACLVAGTNDLAQQTGVSTRPDRRHLAPWLMQIVLAARAGGLDVLDGVFNDFSDGAGFARECEETAAMGFDGKTLIHPSQIDAANRAFAPSEEALAEARAIVDAFASQENAGRGAIAVDGRMVERLHLAQAERLLARAAEITGDAP